MDLGRTVCRTWEQGAGVQNTETMHRTGSEGKWRDSLAGVSAALRLRPWEARGRRGRRGRRWGVGRRALY